MRLPPNNCCRGILCFTAVIIGCADRSHIASDSTARQSSISQQQATAIPPPPTSPDTARALARGDWPISPDSVGRLRGDTLELRLTTGKYAQLTNVGPIGDPHLTYTYRDILKGGAYYIVFVHYYESGGIVLVDRASGDQITMVGQPVVSPSDSLAVASAYSLDIAEGENEIQIWQLLPHPATLAWSMATQRVIYWSGKYSGEGPTYAQGHEGLGFQMDRKLYLTIRRSVLGRFPCDAVRMSLITEACRLSDYPSGSGPHLLAMLDSLGVGRLPWDEHIGLDGGSVAVEHWDGRTYRWYFYWEPNATSLNPSVRAAAEITRRVWAIFERPPGDGP